jgi:acetyltransferase EpsM
MTRPIVFVGYKSDLSIFVDVATARGIPVRGIMDKNFLHETDIEGVPMLGSEEELETTKRHWIDECDFFISSFYNGVENRDDPDKSGDTIRVDRINYLESLGCTFATLIHPYAFVHPTAKIGRGVCLGWMTNVGYKAELGDHSILTMANGLGHHCNVKRNLIMLPKSSLGGYIDVGENVMMGYGSAVLPGQWKTPVTIGNNVKIHAGAYVMKSLGNNESFGMHGKTFRRTDINHN